MSFDHPTVQAIARTARAMLAAASVLPAAFAATGAQPALPRLERVTTPALDSLGPEKAGASIAISTSGLIAFSGGFDSQNRAVTIIDNTGRLLSRVGPRGKGPGELSGPVQLAFAGSELVVHELAARRVSRFAPDGRLHATVASLSPIFIAAAAGDSIDVFVWPTVEGARPYDFRRISPQTLEGRTLLAGQSASLRELAAESLQQGASIASVLFAAAGSTVVAASVVTGRLVGIGADERILFGHPGRTGDTSPKETPIVAMGGLQVDGRERVWAIGPSLRTGKPTASLYVGSRALGRLDLPCNGSITISGSWLAMLCDTPDNPNRDVELRVYRIVDSR
jgi:hypothetical protein